MPGQWRIVLVGDGAGMLVLPVQLGCLPLKRLSLHARLSCGACNILHGNMHVCVLQYVHAHMC